MADDGYGKYRKMLKMGIPRQQVNASMLMDGKDPEKFSEQDSAEATAGGEAASLDLTLKGDHYDKYRKMLKCGLPMGAALQAMAKDGVDPKGFDIGGGVATSSTSNETTTPALATSSSDDDSGNNGSTGGGFLNELKARAEKKGKSDSSMENASPSKSVVAPSKPSDSKPSNSPLVIPKPSTAPPPPVPVIPKLVAIPVFSVSTVSSQDGSPKLNNESMETKSHEDPLATTCKPTSSEPVPSITSSSPEVSESFLEQEESGKREIEHLEPPVVNAASMSTALPNSSLLAEAASIANKWNDSKAPPSPIMSSTTKSRTSASSSPIISAMKTGTEQSSSPIMGSTKSSVGISNSKMDDILNQVIEEHATAPALTPSPILPSSGKILIPETTNKVTTNSTESNASGSTNIAPKKWTPPTKASNVNDNDWKGLLANNRITVEAKKSGPAPTNVANPPPASTTPVETSAVLPKSTPASATKTNSAPILNAKSVTQVAPMLPGAKMTTPAASTSLPSKSTTPATKAVPSKPMPTLKKRNSSDWKTSLTPNVESTKTSPTKTLNAAPKAQILVSSSNGPSPQRDVNVNRPANVNSISKSPSVNMAAVTSLKPTVVGSSSSSSSSPAKTNSVGLSRTSQKQLPAWAAVEKPSFLMNPGATETNKDQVSNTPASTSVKSATSGNVSSPVLTPSNRIAPSISPPKPAGGSTAKPGMSGNGVISKPSTSTGSTIAVAPIKPSNTVSVKKDTTPIKTTAAKPTSTSTTTTANVQYSTVPKGLQRRFAWE